MPVVDASLLVAATTDAGAEGIWAEEIVAAGNLVAPHLVLVETANILCRLEATGHLSKLEATAAHRDLLRLDLELVPYEPLAERVWELRANLTSYDAWHVALAEALDLPLATLDARMSRAPGPECEFPVPPG